MMELLDYVAFDEMKNLGVSRKMIISLYVYKYESVFISRKQTIFFLILRGKQTIHQYHHSTTIYLGRRLKKPLTC